MQRGTVKNTDSNWNINVGSLGAKDTISHSGREKISAKMLSEIDQIIENAVLLDTETSQRSSNNKHNDTAWMHKLYAFVDYNDTPYIAKITVEEYGVNESARRFYNLRGIKIEPIGGAPDVKTSYGTMPVIDSTTSIANSPNGILSVSEGLTDGKSATANNTVAALYNFVKRFDKDFSAGAAVNPILLNKDGTPKVFYHGAKKNGGFTEFRPWQYFTAQKNYAQRYAERGNDNSLYAVYLRADKAFDTRDAEAKQIFENIRQEYGLGELQDTGLPDWTDGYDISDYLDEHPELGYDAIILDEGGDLVDGKPVSRGESIVIKDSSQIKSATDNIGTFDKGNRDILYELRDNQGRELTQAQAEKFKDSQVRDNDGRLKTVYHGSSAVFNVFSADFMSQHGSSEGQGFYFTDYKDMAEGYQKKGGQLLEGYLNITNPLSDSEVTLSAPEVKRLLKALDPTGDDVILNYDSQGGMGYPSKAWYNRALADTVNMIMSTSESDSEILAEIANAGAGSGNVMDAVRKVLGYDGYIVEGKYDNANVYVAFGSDQFKSFDNKTPTSSPDIHLELRSDENQFNPRKELSNLFMQIAQNEQETKSLRSYQAAIHELNNTEIEISKLQQEMQGTDKLKSPQKYYELQNKLRQAEAKLNRYDGRLVQLEATKPMKDLIARREQRLKEQFARSSTTRAKYRNNIKKNIRSLDKKLRTNSGQKHVLLELQPVVAQLLNVFTENTSVFKKEQLARLREIYAKFSPEADSKISSTEKEVTRWKSTAEYSSAYSEMIYDLIEEVRPLVQGKRLIDLDTELLAAVNDIVGNIKQKNTVPESLPRRRFSVVDQSEHFTAKPPLKKYVFVRTSFGYGLRKRYFCRFCV